MTDETKKIDELENKLQELGYNDAGNYGMPADAGDADMAAVAEFIAEHDGLTEEMPDVEDDTADTTTAQPEPTRVRKGVFTNIAALSVIMLMVAVVGTVAIQPSASGIGDGGSSSAAASSAASATAKSSSSAATSSSSAASAASASASAASSKAAASDEAAKVEGGQASSGGSTAQAQQGATQAGGSTSGNTSASTGGGTSGGNTSSGNGGGTAAAQPAHVHDWVPITEPHDVIDRDEWDEVVYETVDHFICNVCGDVGDVDGFQHLKTHELGVSGGYREVTVPVDTIHHPADKHVEYEVVGYRCSECGATK